MAARESMHDRRSRRRQALLANAARLRKKIQFRKGHPTEPLLRQKLAECEHAIAIHAKQAELDALRKARPGDHSIEVPAGDLTAKGQKVGG